VDVGNEGNIGRNGSRAPFDVPQQSYGTRLNWTIISELTSTFCPKTGIVIINEMIRRK